MVNIWIFQYKSLKFVFQIFYIYLEMARKAQKSSRHWHILKVIDYSFINTKIHSYLGIFEDSLTTMLFTYVKLKLYFNLCCYEYKNYRTCLHDLNFSCSYPQTEAKVFVCLTPDHLTQQKELRFYIFMPFLMGSLNWKLACH